MAMELGWHKLYRNEPEKVRDIPELEVRKRRNLERTWLVLFVYDRRSVYHMIEYRPDLLTAA